MHTSQAINLFPQTETQETVAVDHPDLFVQPSMDLSLEASLSASGTVALSVDTLTELAAQVATEAAVSMEAAFSATTHTALSLGYEVDLEVEASIRATQPLPEGELLLGVAEQALLRFQHAQQAVLAPDRPNQTQLVLGPPRRTS